MPRVKRRRDSESAVDLRAHKKSAYGRLSRRSRLYNILALPETKVTSSYADTGAYTAATANSHIMPLIAAGDGADQREGMRVFPQWLRIRNRVTYTTGNAPQGGVFRRIVWIDWGFNGAAISPLEGGMAGALTAISNLYKNRVKILRDDLVAVSPTEPLAMDTFIDLKPYYSVPGKNYIQYTGTGSGDINTGAVFIWYIFSNNVADGGFGYNHQFAFKS